MMKETMLVTVRRPENILRAFRGSDIDMTDHSLVYHDTVKDLDAKILKIKDMICEQFPELSAMVNEVPEIVVDENFADTQPNRLRLKKRYESLNNLMNRYKLECHFKSK